MVAEGAVEAIKKKESEDQKPKKKTDYISSRAPLFPAKFLQFLTVLEGFSGDRMDCFSCCTLSFSLSTSSC